MFGVVVIGRNEGERLCTSLRSAICDGSPVVYVDSGSNDGSPDRARSIGADVLELDVASPFTAARARNEGFKRLLQITDLKYVQFLDGDSKLLDGWTANGVAALERDPRLAAVFGILHEANSEASAFKRLLDLEWNRAGEARPTFGGNVMLRAEALRNAGGFNPLLHAGEEPELRLRLLNLGWEIRRLEVPMAEHDAGPFGFWEWWRREARSGAAIAASVQLHFARGDRKQVRRLLSISFWGGLLPLASILGAYSTDGTSLFFLLAYPIQIARVFFRLRYAGRHHSDAMLEAFGVVAAKPAQAIGTISYAISNC